MCVGSGELRAGGIEHRGGRQDIADVSDDTIARWCDVPHSQLPSGECVREWWAGRKTMTSSGARLLDRHVYAARTWCGGKTADARAASTWPSPKIYVTSDFEPCYILFSKRCASVVLQMECGEERKTSQFEVRIRDSSYSI